MKSSFVAAMLLSVSSGVVFAQDMQAQSHIESVTVYPQGADILRVAKVDLAGGEDTIVFTDLPEGVDPQSIRLEGSGVTSFEIGSVDTKLQSLTEANTGERKALETQIDKLNDERGGLDRSIGDYETERKLLLTLADKTRVQSSGVAAPNAVDVAGLDVMLTTVATRLATTSKAIQDGKIRQRIIDKEIAALQLKVQNFAAEGLQHLQASVHIASKAPMVADLRLSYRVQNAAWHAFYDARLSLPKEGEDPRFSLVRRAEVQQATGEDWNDVHLILSTAQPASGAAAPNLEEQQLSNMRAEGKVMRAPAPASLALDKAASSKMKNGGEQEVADAAEKPAIEQQAQVQSTGFDANYVIDERVSIDKNGTSKKVNIGSTDYKGKLTVESVPRLDRHAYLSVAFTTSADAPLLSGPVNLFRDGSYVGQVAMNEFASGEEAKLGFGVDDLVKVKRNEVNRMAAQVGLITSSDTQEMAWDITITNLHGMKMPIRIVDRKPFSSDEKILVSDVAGVTPASVTDVEHKRGVLAWDLNLEPKAKAEIHTGYKITTPKDVYVGMVD